MKSLFYGGIDLAYSWSATYDLSKVGDVLQKESVKLPCLGGINLPTISSATYVLSE